MIVRSLVRFAGAAVVLAALSAGSTAWAHDRRRPQCYGYGYDSQYDHYRRDQHRAYDHYRRDRRESFGHALGDVFRYGSTNPYSSPEHYHRDRHRAYDHDQRDHWEDQRHHESDFYRYGEW